MVKIGRIGQEVEVDSTFCNIISQLEQRILLRDHNELAKCVVIRATASTNLQCNNVALQVGGKCCSYYRTFTSLIVWRGYQGTELLKELGDQADCANDKKDAERGD